MKKTFKFAIIGCLMLLFCIIVFAPIIYVKFSFKTDYKDIISTELNNTRRNSEDLNVNFVLSVIKAESGFNANAQSQKNAFGLMQLTYLTAKDMAKSLNIEITLNDLFNPNINIKLGICYLNFLFKQNSDKQIVLMCYNAGLNRVNSWIENKKLQKFNGLYVCPFEETTKYVERVINNEKIYNKILGKK